jgi:hypothetical protein
VILGHGGEFQPGAEGVEKAVLDERRGKQGYVDADPAADTILHFVHFRGLLSDVAILKIFSKRQKEARGECPDVYQYDDIPRQFRVQVIHIFNDTVGLQDQHPCAQQIYEFVWQALCREYGTFRLAETGGCAEQVQRCLLESANHEQVLDVIELTLKTIDEFVRRNGDPFLGYAKMTLGEAIEDLNQRFKEHGIGYQFESGEIIRMDSKVVHEEVVKPVLLLLRGGVYAGANDEFLRAHEHYRRKRYKECLNECLKSFESTMKAICHKRKWSHSPTDTAKPLIETCLKNGLIPAFWQSHFAGLRATLEAGVPTVRNRTAGHGQGAIPTEVPQSLASYVLHLTATTILLLAEAETELP